MSHLVSPPFVLGLTAVFLILVHRFAGVQFRRTEPKNHPVQLLAIASLATLLVLAQAVGESRYGHAPPVPVSGGLQRLVFHMAELLLFVQLIAVLITAIGRRHAKVDRRPRFVLICLPFAAAWCISVVVSSRPGASSAAWLVLLTFVGLTVTLDNGANIFVAARALARFVVSCCLAVALVAPGWAFAPYGVWPGGWRPGLDRLQGVFPQPNPMGWFAAFAILLEVFAAEGGRTRRILWGSAGAVCLGLSGSRSAAFACLVGLLAGGFLAGSRRTRIGPLAIAIGLLVVVGQRALISASEALTSGANGRASTWSAAWHVFRSNPNFGVGPGAYRTNHNLLEAVPYAHNQVLHTAAEMGVPGIVCLAVLTGGLVWRVLRRPRNALAVSVTAAWLVLYGTENLLRFTEMTFFLPVLLAMLCWGVDSTSASHVDAASREREFVPAHLRVPL